MDQKELQSMFEATLDDRRLSRSERLALKAVLDEVSPRPEERLAMIGRAFDAARGALAGPAGRQVLDWLEALVKTLYPEDVASVGAARFAPRQDCAAKIRELFDAAKTSVEVCVFTITDDSIVRAILAARGRGVAVRIISDDEKARDLGSDVYRLMDSGVPVRMDASEDHMHHKFAVFDRRLLVTGSYNWTRRAAKRNRENVALTDDKRLVALFREEFERLWSTFAPS